MTPDLIDNFLIEFGKIKVQVFMLERRKVVVVDIVIETTVFSEDGVIHTERNSDIAFHLCVWRLADNCENEGVLCVHFAADFLEMFEIISTLSVDFGVVIVAGVVRTKQLSLYKCMYTFPLSPFRASRMLEALDLTLLSPCHCEFPRKPCHLKVHPPFCIPISS